MRTFQQNACIVVLMLALVFSQANQLQAQVDTTAKKDTILVTTMDTHYRT